MAKDDSYSKNVMVRLSGVGWDEEDDWDDFCQADLSVENDDKEDSSLPTLPSTCETPKDHRFDRLLLLNIYHRECIFCGYSPDLDSCKPEWGKCHRAFARWESRRKIKR